MPDTGLLLMGCSGGVVVAPPAPVAYYKHDETGTGTRFDATANHLDLTNTNGATNGTGVLNNATAFTNASSQYLSVADAVPVDFTTKYSASVWLKLTTINPLATYNVIQKGEYLASTLEWSLYFAPGTAKLGYFYAGQDLAGNAAGSTVLSVSTWYHLVVVFDGTLTGDANRLKIYVNGVAETLTFGATGVPATNPVSTGPLCLGALYAFTQYLDGLLDETSLWNVALSQAQVTYLYGSGTPPAYPLAGMPAT